MLQHVKPCDIKSNFSNKSSNITIVMTHLKGVIRFRDNFSQVTKLYQIIEHLL